MSSHLLGEEGGDWWVGGSFLGCSGMDDWLCVYVLRNPSGQIDSLTGLLFMTLKTKFQLSLFLFFRGGDGVFASTCHIIRACIFDDTQKNIS